MTDPTDREVEQHFADVQASAYAEMFRQTGNGVFVWKAFRVYRSRGLPVREDILKMFDAMAASLDRASGADELLGALHLKTSTGGGAQAATAAASHERQFRIAQNFVAALAAGMTQKDAVHAAARNHGTTDGNVRVILSRLMKKRPALRKRASPALDALPRWGNKLR